MDELSKQVIAPCPAQQNGMPCVLAETHSGPHQRVSPVTRQPIEWEDSPGS